MTILFVVYLVYGGFRYYLMGRKIIRRRWELWRLKVLDNREYMLSRIAELQLRYHFKTPNESGFPQLLDGVITGVPYVDPDRVYDLGVDDKNAWVRIKNDFCMGTLYSGLAAIYFIGIG